MESKEKKSSGTKFQEYKGEFLKITWPTKSELAKQTITVIIICLLIGIITFTMDFSLNWLVSQFISLLG